MTTKAQIHRFGDTVAVYVENGQTVYLTPEDARELAYELAKCANDCEARKFAHSRYVTKELAFADTGYNGTDFKIERN